MYAGAFLVFLAFLILVIIVLKTYRTRQAHAAASNIVFAKYTHGELPKNKQKQVHEKAIEIVKQTEPKIRGFANEVERYGWYAKAMDSLNIPSAVPQNPVWHKVKNPYYAIKPGSMMIRGVSAFIAKEYNINLTVSEAKNYTGSKVRRDTGSEKIASEKTDVEKASE